LILLFLTPTTTKGENPFTDKFPMRILAVGDVMLARGVASICDTAGDFYPFAGTFDILNDADLLTGNIETTISDRGIPMEKKYVFRANPEFANILSRVGFDCLTFANNHAFDYGKDAFFDTIRLLEKSGVKVVGAGENIYSMLEPKQLNIKGYIIGFLGFNATGTNFLGERNWGCAPASKEYIRKAVPSAKQSCDILIVHFHWGEEDSFLPDEEQIELAHETIELGADIVIGSHPHRIQPVEFYKGGIIFYSLGNFIFDQNDFENNISVIAEIDILPDTAEVRLIPIETISHKASPSLAKGEIRNVVLDLLNDISYDFGTEFIEYNGEFMVREFSSSF